MRLNVFFNAYGNRLFVGVLEEQNKRTFFEYAPEFLKKNIPLSPFMLPLKQQVYEDEKNTFDGLYGVFNDSLPDGWGCLLLDRKLQKKGLSYNAITPLQRLSFIGLNVLHFPFVNTNIYSNTFPYLTLRLPVSVNVGFFQIIVSNK